jgi:hypothetical protein
MKVETYEQMLGEVPRSKKGMEFIEELVARGVPVESIMTNDWACSYPPKVFVTVPYGAPKNAGQHKMCRRFSINDVIRVCRWYRESTEVK